MSAIRAALRKRSQFLLVARNFSPLFSRRVQTSAIYHMKEYEMYDVHEYPKVKRISAQRLPADADYWDVQERRLDKETPLHYDDDALLMWMTDSVYQGDRYSVWQVLGHLGIMLSLLAALFGYGWWLNVPETKSYAVPKQYPFNNLYLERGGDPEDLKKE